MSHAKSDAAADAVPRSRRSLANMGAFIFGLPAGLGILTFLLSLPEGTEARRYVHHPVERVEVILFCCAMGALFGKVLGQWTERKAFRHELLPAWNGQPVAVTEAGLLRAGLNKFAMCKTYVVRRVGAVLDFVKSRGSANELDDQIRALADNDIMALEGSYAFIRLIIWAIPILGFLGTVLGITGAISGVTPEILEKSLSTVTDGLALAFDTTALALGLTMVLMFVNSMVDRLEQRTLEAVDRYVDEHLAHRFERTAGPETGAAGPALRQTAEFLLKTTEQLVERQAAVWAKSMEKADRALTEGTARQQEKLCSALEAALEHTLTNHQQRLVDLEKHAVQQSKTLFDSITALATAVRDAGRQHQETLAKITEKVAAQTDTLAKLQMGEAHLVRLQEKLEQNLNALAGSGAFEQAVQSLTAAIHLLTARAGAAGNRLDVWSSKAA
jgi:biopolymer transport protein ExbB/TolQ